MGKFSRNRKYTFVSLEELISSVIEEFNEGSDIRIVLPWEEVNDILTAVISTGKFKINLLDYELPEMGNYVYEYCITLSHLDSNALFIEKIYNCEKNRYITFCNDVGDDIVFISDGILKVCYDHITDSGCYTVLFNIEE